MRRHNRKSWLHYIFYGLRKLWWNIQMSEILVWSSPIGDYFIQKALLIAVVHESGRNPIALWICDWIWQSFIDFFFVILDRLAQNCLATRLTSLRSKVSIHTFANTQKVWNLPPIQPNLQNFLGQGIEAIIQLWCSIRQIIPTRNLSTFNNQYTALCYSDY
jgi:hypothetical protein